MADQRNGGISWTEQTWNPIRGCRRVNKDCIHCYAETVATRFSGPGNDGHIAHLAVRPPGPYFGLIENGRWNGKIRTVPEHLTDPLHWKRPRLVFVNSMSDLFFPTGALMVGVGKKAAGNLLDGRAWAEYPTGRHG